MIDKELYGLQEDENNYREDLELWTTWYEYYKLFFDQLYNKYDIKTSMIESTTKYQDLLASNNYFQQLKYAQNYMRNKYSTYYAKNSGVFY